jgi:hypothetical protein
MLIKDIVAYGYRRLLRYRKGLGGFAILDWLLPGQADPDNGGLLDVREPHLWVQRQGAINSPSEDRSPIPVTERRLPHYLSRLPPDRNQTPPANTIRVAPIQRKNTFCRSPKSWPVPASQVLPTGHTGCSLRIGVLEAATKEPMNINAANNSKAAPAILYRSRGCRSVVSVMAIPNPNPKDTPERGVRLQPDSHPLPCTEGNSQWTDTTACRLLSMPLPAED